MDPRRSIELHWPSQMVKYMVTDPKQLGTFVPDGPLINLEGKLGTYKSVSSVGG